MALHLCVQWGSTGRKTPSPASGSGARSQQKEAAERRAAEAAEGRQEARGAVDQREGWCAGKGMPVVPAVGRPAPQSPAVGSSRCPLRCVCCAVEGSVRQVGSQYVQPTLLTSPLVRCLQGTGRTFCHSYEILPLWRPCVMATVVAGAHRVTQSTRTRDRRVGAMTSREKTVGKECVAEMTAVNIS